MTYVYLRESKAVLYNVVIIRHFNTVNTLDMVESRYSRMSIIQWSPGIICTVVLTVVHTLVG